MPSYDRALTVFNPEGRLFQVEYAMEVVQRGNIAIAIKNKDHIAIGIRKKAQAKLQDTRVVKKIMKLDDHIHATYAGLTADARVLISMARVACQSYRLSYACAPTVEFVARWIAEKQQKYTQSGGVRPFGVSIIVSGFDPDGTPRIFKTEPSGTYTQWAAATIGKESKSVLEFLEGRAAEGFPADAAGLRALMEDALAEVVQRGEDNVEVAVFARE